MKEETLEKLITSVDAKTVLDAMQAQSQQTAREIVEMMNAKKHKSIPTSGNFDYREAVQIGAKMAVNDAISILQDSIKNKYIIN